MSRYWNVWGHLYAALGILCLVSAKGLHENYFSEAVAAYTLTVTSFSFATFCFFMGGGNKK
jgi:hypothetical protein